MAELIWQQRNTETPTETIYEVTDLVLEGDGKSLLSPIPFTLCFKMESNNSSYGSTLTPEKLTALKSTYRLIFWLDSTWEIDMDKSPVWSPHSNSNDWTITGEATAIRTHCNEPPPIPPSKTRVEWQQGIFSDIFLCDSVQLQQDLKSLNPYAVNVSLHMKLPCAQRNSEYYTKKIPLPENAQRRLLIYRDTAVQEFLFGNDYKMTFDPSSTEFCERWSITGTAFSAKLLDLMEENHSPAPDQDSCSPLTELVQAVVYAHPWLPVLPPNTNQSSLACQELEHPVSHASAPSCLNDVTGLTDEQVDSLRQVMGLKPLSTSEIQEPAPSQEKPPIVLVIQTDGLGHQRNTWIKDFRHLVSGGDIEGWDIDFYGEILRQSKKVTFCDGIQYSWVVDDRQYSFQGTYDCFSDTGNEKLQGGQFGFALEYRETPWPSVRRDESGNTYTEGLCVSPGNLSEVPAVDEVNHQKVQPAEKLPVIVITQTDSRGNQRTTHVEDFQHKATGYRGTWAIDFHGKVTQQSLPISFAGDIQYHWVLNNKQYSFNSHYDCLNVPQHYPLKGNQFAGGRDYKVTPVTDIHLIGRDRMSQVLIPFRRMFRDGNGNQGQTSDLKFEQLPGGRFRLTIKLQGNNSFAYAKTEVESHIQNSWPVYQGYDCDRFNWEQDGKKHVLYYAQINPDFSGDDLMIIESDIIQYDVTEPGKIDTIQIESKGLPSTTYTWTMSYDPQDYLIAGISPITPPEAEEEGNKLQVLEARKLLCPAPVPEEILAYSLVCSEPVEMDFTMGAITPNEARELQGRESFPGECTREQKALVFGKAGVMGEQTLARIQQAEQDLLSKLRSESSRWSPIEYLVWSAWTISLSTGGVFMTNFTDFVKPGLEAEGLLKGIPLGILTTLLSWGIVSLFRWAISSTPKQPTSAELLKLRELFLSTYCELADGNGYVKFNVPGTQRMDLNFDGTVDVLNTSGVGFTRLELPAHESKLRQRLFADAKNLCLARQREVAKQKQQDLLNNLRTLKV